MQNLLDKWLTQKNTSFDAKSSLTHSNTINFNKENGNPLSVNNNPQFL